MAEERTENMVILVDDRDREIGLEEKMKAHRDGGKLHRAISIIVFNSKGEMMLQQRSDTKYHSAGLWANTCCSHPLEGESAIDAAHRRLKQEMGFDCEMGEVFTFIYKTPVGSGLTEWEYDHVVFGLYDGKPKPNQNEVKDWKWVPVERAMADVKKNSGSYTGWFKILMADKEVSPKFMQGMKEFLRAKNIRTSP